MPSAELAIARRRGRAILLWTSIFVSACMAVGFAPELYTLYWHAQHGNKFDVAGVRLRIPLLSSVSQHNNETVVVQHVGGIRYALGVRSGETKLTLQSSPLVIESKRALGPRVATHPSALTGAMLLCAEYPLLYKKDEQVVICQRSSAGLVPTYDGPARGLPGFYRLLASATSVATPTTADAP